MLEKIFSKKNHIAPNVGLKPTILRFKSLMLTTDFLIDESLGKLMQLGNSVPIVQFARCPEYSLYCLFVFWTAMYGVFFHDNQEPAFSNYRLWESLGFVIAFAYANFLCINVKLIILLAMLIVSLVGYFMAEYINKMQVDREYSLAAGMVLKEGKTGTKP